MVYPAVVGMAGGKPEPDKANASKRRRWTDADGMRPSAAAPDVASEGFCMTEEQMVVALDIFGSHASLAMVNVYFLEAVRTRGLEGLRRSIDLERRRDSEVSYLTNRLIALIEAGLGEETVANIPGPGWDDAKRALWRAWMDVALLHYNAQHGCGADAPWPEVSVVEIAAPAESRMDSPGEGSRRLHEVLSVLSKELAILVCIVLCKGDSSIVTRQRIRSILEEEVFDRSVLPTAMEDPILDDSYGEETCEVIMVELRAMMLILESEYMGLVGVLDLKPVVIQKLKSMEARIGPELRSNELRQAGLESISLDIVSEREIVLIQRRRRLLERRVALNARWLVRGADRRVVLWLPL